MTSRGRRRRGFTLMEVMAAVGILALVYGLLSETGVEGLILEGEADRHLRGSLLADRWLADLEVQVTQGMVPPVGHMEEEEDEFRVVVDVTPFEMPVLEPEGGALPTGGDGAAAGAIDVPSLLAPPGRGADPPLRTLEVTVSWDSGRGGERSVRRTSYALDTAAVQMLLEQAGLGAIDSVEDAEQLLETFTQ